MREMFRIAYSVKMEAEDTAEVKLWGEITGDVPKWYKDEFPEDKNAADFDKAIKDVRAGGARKLMLRINSPGGIVSESVAMRSILANAGFEEITIRIEGLCASAATIVASLPGAKVEIAEGSEYMIHNPWTFAIGNATELERVAENLRNTEETVCGFYEKRSGQDAGQIREWMEKETWFTAKQAVEYGFCDELLEAEKEMPAAACVGTRAMDVMRGMYRAIPEGIRVEDAAAEPSAEGKTTSSDRLTAATFPMGEGNDKDSKCSPEAGERADISDKEEKNMELNELTREQLASENPALMNEIIQQAVAAERERVNGIDAVTMPGFESDAAQAKADGTSVEDFIRGVVAKSREKGADFLKARQEETKPAAQVRGDGADDRSEEDEIAEEAKRNAAYAAEMAGHGSGMF